MSRTSKRVRSPTPAWRAFSVAMLHQVRIEVDAKPARAALRRLDDDAAVARAEVDHVVALLHLRHAHHPLDDLHRRLHVRHRAVVPRPGLRLRECGYSGDQAGRYQDLQFHIGRLKSNRASSCGPSCRHGPTVHRIFGELLYRRRPTRGTTKQRLLKKAAQLIGSEKLAAGLNVPVSVLDLWMRGLATMPDRKMLPLADLPETLDQLKKP